MGALQTAPEALLGRLAALGIAQTTIRHPPVFTVAEAKRLRGEIAGGHVKNLFLRNKKGRMWLLVCLEDQPVDLKALGRSLGVGPFSFASHDRLRRTLGIEPGSVTPLAAINDRAGAVQILLDRAMLAVSPLNFHPLVNTMTTTLAPADLLAFLEAENHPPHIVDLAAVMAAG